MAAPTILLAVLGAVLLACVQGGCRAAPRPAARTRAAPEPPVQQQQAYDAWRTAAHQVTCALYGLHAERLVQHREVGQVTLLEGSDKKQRKISVSPLLDQARGSVAQA
jgi:hypothetical protein